MITLLSCGGDEEDSQTNNDCAFIGKWCTEDPLNDGQCWSLGLINIEFRANGEFFFQSTTSQNWQSSNCNTVEIYNTPTGLKQAEYEIIEVSETRLVIDLGTVSEFIKEN